MKLKKYSKYKNSGIDWIGEIPEEWRIRKVKHITDILTCGLASTPEYVEEEKGVPFLSAQNVKPNRMVFNKFNYISKELHRQLTRQRKVKRGDILLTRVGGESNIGETCIVDVDFDFSIYVSLTHIRVNKNTNNKYLMYFFLSDIAKYLHTTGTIDGGGQGNLNVDNVRKYTIPLPPLQTQQKISSFLDSKTAQIEKLIEKDRNLIELLKEKRVSLINQAVTKGIEKNVKMKDSGVEWIGEIPESWSVRKLKHLTKQIIDGTHSTPTYVESGVPFLRVTDIQDDSINFDEIKYIPEIEHKELSFRCKPKKGDLLLSKNGTIGIPKVVDWDFEFSIFVSLCLIKPFKNLNVNFLKYFFLSQTIKEQIFYRSKTTSVTNLHLDQISEFDITLPYINEQQEIVEFLDKETVKIDNHIKKVERRIELYEEYKKSLIYNVVTGKVEV